MSDTVTVIVGHSLGKDEAVRRLKDSFARNNGQLGAMIATEAKAVKRLLPVLRKEATLLLEKK